MTARRGLVFLDHSGTYLLGASPWRPPCRKLAKDAEEEVRSALGAELGALCCRLSLNLSPSKPPFAPEGSRGACESCQAACGAPETFEGGPVAVSVAEGVRGEAQRALWEVELLLLDPHQVPRVRASSLQSLTTLLAHTPRDSPPPFDVLDIIELCIEMAHTEATRGPALRALMQCFRLGPPGASLGRAVSQSPSLSEESQEGNEKVLQLMAPLRHLLHDGASVEEGVFALDAAAAIFLGAERWGKIRLFAYLILVSDNRGRETRDVRPHADSCIS